MRLTLYSANASSLCPHCSELAARVSQLEDTFTTRHPVGIATINCDLLPPGSDPCLGVSSLPLIRLDGDEFSEALPEGTRVSPASLRSWIARVAELHALTIDFPPTTLEDGSTTYFSNQLRVKSETGKALREMTESPANEVVVTLHYTSECAACGPLLLELEILARENTELATLRVIRSPADTLTRTKLLFLGQDEDVPLISFLDRREECSLTAPCFPVLFRGSGSLRSALRTQFRLPIQNGDNDSSLRSQLQTLRGTRLSFGISEVFINSPAALFETFLSTCRSSETGCLILFVSDWFVGREEGLQQDINQFIGAAKMASRRELKTRFAIVDLSSTDALQIISDVTERSVPELCPNAVCVWQASSRGLERIRSYAADAELLLRAIGSELDTLTATEQMLTKPSEWVLYVKEFRQLESDSRVVLPADVRLHPSSRKVLTLTLPPVVSKRFAFNQCVRRQMAAFENMCRALNASVSDITRPVCGAIDGSAFPEEAQKTLVIYAAATLNNPEVARRVSPSLVVSLESLGDGIAASASLLFAGGNDAEIVDLSQGNLLSPASALTSRLLVDLGRATRQASLLVSENPVEISYVKRITANTLESSLHDAQFAKFVLFGGGSSCPHTQSLLPMLEKVAKVFHRDRREVFVAHVDVTRDLSREVRENLQLSTVPQLRFFPKGGFSERGSHHVGDPFPGTPYYTSVLEYLHQRMGYPFMETDISSDRNATFESLSHSALSKKLSSERTKGTTLFVYDTLTRDRDTMKKLFSMWAAHFRDHDDYGGRLEFFRVDGRRHEGVLKRFGIAVRSLPTLVFLPQEKPLEAQEIFSPNKGFDAIDVARWLVGFVDKEPESAFESFEFTVDEQRDHARGRLNHVTHLDGGTFSGFVQSRGDNAVLFYLSDCAHCQSFLKHFQEAAQHFQESNVHFGVVELTGNSEIGHGQGIQKVPLVRLFFEGSSFKQHLRGEDFVGLTNTSEALISFIDSIRGSPKVNRLDAIRDAQDKSVMKLQNKSAFDSFVGTSPGGRLHRDFTLQTRDEAATYHVSYDDSVYLPPALIEFATPWCGHCHYMTKILLELGRYIEKHVPIRLYEPAKPLRIAKIDATEFSSIAKLYHVEEYPTIVLYYTRVLPNGTMRHCFSTYKGLRFTDKIAAFVRSNLEDSVYSPPSSPTVRISPPRGEEPPESLPEAEEAFNSSIPVLSAKDIRMLTRRTAIALIMTFDSNVPSSHIMLWNDIWRVVSDSTPFKRGFMVMGLFPSRKVELVSNVTGWRVQSQPQISLFRGTATPSVVHLNSTTVSSLVDEDGLAMSAEHPIPSTVLKFLDSFIDRALTFPDTLNETTFKSKVGDLVNKSASLHTLAVLFVNPSCVLCESMLSSTSYSAQSQMVAHLVGVEVTLLNVDKAPSIYKQFGRPELPCLIVLQKAGSLKEIKARALDLPTDDENQKKVPPRNLVHRFIVGHSEALSHGREVVPSSSFYLEPSNLSGYEHADISIPLIHFTDAADFLDQSSKGVHVVLISGRFSTPGSRRVLTAFQRARNMLKSVFDIDLSVLELPRNSRLAEVELRRAGFKGISQPSIFLRHNKGGLKVEKYVGDKANESDIVKFVLDSVRI